MKPMIGVVVSAVLICLLTIATGEWKDQYNLATFTYILGGLQYWQISYFFFEKK